MDRASATVGLEDFGSDHFRPLLDGLCADLDGDTLSPVGRKVFAGMAISTLTRRLRLVETLRRHPEIHDVALPPILHISGFPRTGTTLLHNLLDRHPAVRTLASWELKEPLPPPEAATYTSDPRIEAASAALAPLRGGPLEQLHWVEPEEPDENQWALTDLRGLLGGAAWSVLPGWRAAAGSWDSRAGFAELAATIRLLLWRNPVPDGGLLVLKDPVTTAELRTFMAVFDQAPVVVVHRDPLRVLRSSGRVAHVVNNPFLTAPDPLRDDANGERLLMTSLPLIAEALVDAADRQPDRMHHVRYADLVGDPVTTAIRVLDAVGVSSGASAETAMRAFLEWQRSGGRAAPPRSYGDFGYTREVLMADERMAAYVERFRIPPEERRLTGTAPA